MHAASHRSLRSLWVGTSLVAALLGPVAAGDAAPRSPFGTLERGAFVAGPGPGAHGAAAARPEAGQTPAPTMATSAPPPAATGPQASAPLVAPEVDEVVFGPASAGVDGKPTRGDAPAAAEVPVRDLSAPPVAAWTPSADKADVTGSVAPSIEETDRLKVRARALLGNGAIAETRALLEGPVGRGDAEASYLLARTYDPAVLARSGVIGVTADPARAESLYAAARAGGYVAPGREAEAAAPR